ncbi:hypothetical protein [Pseudomonas sp. LP23]|uniref:hypothetical protein n=1 Tax=Pseudomonas sp. LP23 TaxID=3029195 RepID=UPI0030BCC707
MLSAVNYREEKLLEKPPFTSYDFGWLVLCIGMAIGSGIVFMPVQLGLKGLWVFLVAVILSYPAVYHLQSLLLRTLINSEGGGDYTGAVSYYLGKNWGVALGCVYFIMLLSGIVTYASTVAHDSASYLQTFGLIDRSLVNEWWYGLVVMTVLVAISSQGERLIFKVAGPMIMIKFGIVVVLALIMIPHWNFSNVVAFPEMGIFFRDVLLTLPFALSSIIFVQILSPMNVAFKSIERDWCVAAYRSIRVNRIAYVILVLAVLFFALSFSFSVSKNEAEIALKQNISALAIAAKVMPGAGIQVMSVMLNIFAIVSAFFGIYLGFHEALKGIVLNLLSRKFSLGANDTRRLAIALSVTIVAFLWGWLLGGFSTLLLIQVVGPIFGVATCLVPCYLVYKIDDLSHLRGKAACYVFAYGVLLIVSPFFKFLE